MNDESCSSIQSADNHNACRRIHILCLLPTVQALIRKADSPAWRHARRQASQAAKRLGLRFPA